MAQPTSHAQIGDEIHPVRTTQSRTFAIDEDPSLKRKAASYDHEEKAIQIADADLNRKNKQVCAFPLGLHWLSFAQRLIFETEIHRMDSRMACVPKYRCYIRRQ